MLCADPKRRITSSQLCEELGDLLRLARSDRSTSLATGRTKDTDKTVLEALLEFEKKASSNAAEADKPKFVGEVQQKAQGAANGNMEVKAGVSLANPQDRQPRKSRRIGKSERLDNITLAKTAHRAEILEAELNSHDLPTVRESPIEHEADAAADPGKPRETDFRSSPRRLASPATHSRNGLGAPRKPDGSLPNISTSPVTTEYNLHQSEGQTPGASPSQLPSANPKERSSQSLPAQTQHLPSLPSGIVQEKASVVESQNFSKSAPLIHSPSSPVQPPVLDPSFDICKVRQELEKNRSKGFEAQLASIIGRNKKDSYLKKFIKNRDIVSLVINFIVIPAEDHTVVCRG
jgi:hypothetical protein